MKFVVSLDIPREFDPNTLYLLKGVFFGGRLDDSWNDYGFKTRYTLLYCDPLQHRNEIGTVRIGEFSMGETQYSPCLPYEFTSLDENTFFSIGENEEYYKNIVEIENGKGYDILLALNDFTMCRDGYEKAKRENVTQLSLLRSIGEQGYDTYINTFYEILRPPINLSTMSRVFGSTGWDDVDSGLLAMQQLLFGANIHFYYNAIATIGREIIKGIAGKVYEDDLHRNKEEYPAAPNEDQFIIKLHSIVDYLFVEGEITNNMKAYIKATIELVQGYVHKEEADNFECFMCVHAVTSLVFQLSIVCKKDEYNQFIE